MKIAITDDVKLTSDNIVLYFNQIPVFEVLFSAESIPDLLQKPALPQVEILLLDIGLPGISGIEGIKSILQINPQIKIVMLTAFEDEDLIFKALCAGAISYISKRTSLKKIEEALYVVQRGGSYMSPVIAKKVIEYFKPKNVSTLKELTPRQTQIVQGIVDGLSYKLLAERLLISVETVRDHIKHIYKKLNINSKSELVKFYLDKKNTSKNI